MRVNKKYTLLTLVFGLLFSAGVFSQEMKDMKKPKGDIVTIASSNKDLTTLVTAVKAAGLVETLQSDGPFTVFAPTNAAFEALPKGTLEMLLKPENKEVLKSVLTYHVISGEIMSKDVKTMKATTVEGSQAQVEVNEKGVMVDGAKVIKADINASNGVVHVIDKVILPPSVKKGLMGQNEM